MRLTRVGSHTLVNALAQAGIAGLTPEIDGMVPRNLHPIQDDVMAARGAHAKAVPVVVDGDAVVEQRHDVGDDSHPRVKTDERDDERVQENRRERREPPRGRAPAARPARAARR